MAILLLVFSIYVMLIKNRRTFRYFTENQLLETAWTAFPAFFLLSIAIPSLRLLYTQDEMWDPKMTLKVEAHQWYWDYEIPDFFQGEHRLEINSVAYDMKDYRGRGMGYLLEVTNRAVLPINTVVRVLVTSADVLHAFAVPSLGIKLDAVPGRINAWSLNITRPGVYTGQCSEICGVNHAFIPIVIEAAPSDMLECMMENSSSLGRV